MTRSAEITGSCIKLAGSYRTSCRCRTGQVVIDRCIASSSNDQSFCALVVCINNPTALQTAGCAGSQHRRSDAITHIFQNVGGLQEHTGLIRIDSFLSSIGHLFHVLRSVFTDECGSC